MVDKPLVVASDPAGRFVAPPTEGWPAAGSWLPRPYRAMHTGDSLMAGTCSPVGPVSSRVAFAQRLRSRRGDVQCMGPVFAAPGTGPWPSEPLCAGYPGETIAQITARLAPAGSIGAFVLVHGAPDLHFYRAGTNDAIASRTAAQIAADYLAAFTALDALMPSTIEAVHTLPYLFPNTGGNVAKNAVIDQVNAFLRNAVPQRPNYLLLDTGPLISQGDIGPDGIHPLAQGYMLFGLAEAAAFEQCFPLPSGPPQPRAFAPLPAQASALLANKAADKIVDTNPAWGLPANSFCYRLRGNFTDLTNAGALTNILCATPAGQDYTHGIGIAIDNTGTFTAQPALRVNIKGPAIQQIGVLPLAQPCQIFVHGDRTLGVVSLWAGCPASGTLAYAPSNPQAVTLLAVAFGIAPWAAGDPNAVLTVGRYAGAGVNGFAGAVRDVRLAIGTAAVGSFWQARALFEAMHFEAEGDPANTAAYLPCSDGAGPSIASGVPGAPAATLTGGWSAAGAVAWPWDG